MRGQRRPRRSAGHASQQIELTLGAPAAGGACVAHPDETHEAATYFVRGGLPGERVIARTTGSTRGGKVRFATVLEVITASPDRVTPPCPWAGECGGCDFQHVALPAQRAWKAAVLRDQLQRLGRLSTVDGVPLESAVEVVAVGTGPRAGDGEGAEDVADAEGAVDGAGGAGVEWRGWRTRVVVDADDRGQLGFHAHRSSRVVDVQACPVVVEQLQPIFTTHASPGARVHASASDVPTIWADPYEREAIALPPGWRQRAWVGRQAMGRTWRVATDGFWQAHVAAPDVLAAEVQRLAALIPGERALDLYSGVGLFAAALATSTDPALEVVAVEGDTGAARLARRNLHDLPTISVIECDVRDYAFEDEVAVTVLDPPRAGAGTAVIDAVATVTARAIVHVGCDGANTARDLGRLVAAGWELRAFRAFDLFPMTQHVETVALLVKSSR